MKKFNWTEKRINTLIEDYNEGKPLKKIAKKLRTTTNKVGSMTGYLRKEGKIGRRRNYKYWSGAEVARLRKLTKNNTSKAIAKKLSRSVPSVEAAIERFIK